MPIRATRVGANPAPGARSHYRPGNLHQQISTEALTHFGIATRLLDSQEAFDRLTRIPGTPLTHTTPDGRPIVPPGFYLTS